MKQNKIETITKLFKGHEIRSVWNEEEDHYFSVVIVLNNSNLNKFFLFKKTPFLIICINNLN